MIYLLLNDKITLLAITEKEMELHGANRNDHNLNLNMFLLFELFETRQL